jgi:hypothetical protein
MAECCRNPFALLSWLSRHQPGVTGVSAMRSAGLHTWGAQKRRLHYLDLVEQSQSWEILLKPTRASGGALAAEVVRR